MIFVTSINLNKKIEPNLLPSFKNITLDISELHNSSFFFFNKRIF